jgi:hypothetical protein
MNQVQPDFDVVEIVKRANATTGERFWCPGITALTAEETVNVLKDSATSYFVPGVVAADDSILKISNSQFPDSVEQESKKARLARGILSGDLAEAIPSALFEGRLAGRSFAIWPKYRPISGYKIVRAAQKRLLYDDVFAWLRGVAEASIDRKLTADAIVRRCRLPLEHIRAHRQLGEEIRSLAHQALQRLDEGDWHPVSILQHSDLWLGNILLPIRKPRNDKFPFFVIDWGGSVIDGAPALDMVRFCMSANVNLRRAHREFLYYASAIQISLEELVFEIVVGLGLIGTNLNEFPEDRFVDLCKSIFDFLRTVGFSASVRIATQGANQRIA